MRIKILGSIFIIIFTWHFLNFFYKLGKNCYRQDKTIEIKAKEIT